MRSIARGRGLASAVQGGGEGGGGGAWVGERGV